MGRKTVTTVALAAALSVAGATTASAGEITGNGKSLKPLSAKSVCAFSGLNDEFILGDTSAPRVQTPAEGPSGLAGTFCNPNNVPF